MDLQDVQNYLDKDLYAKLKKAQEKASKSATAPMAKTTKKGMTDTPTVPDEPSEKILMISDEIDQFKEHYKDHLESLKSAQEKWGEGC